MNVRLASADDADVFAGLYASVQTLHANAEPSIFKQPEPGVFTPRPVAEILAQAGSAIFIADDEGCPVGYLWATVQEQGANAAVYARRYLAIEHIAVQSGYQRHGVGTALLTHAKQYARSLGLSQIMLNSWSFNAGAHRFFESQGFKVARLTFWAALD